MAGFVTVVLSIVAVFFGLVYGYCYLSAKAQKVPVTSVILELVNRIFRRD